jgi:hypothetical protein
MTDVALGGIAIAVSIVTFALSFWFSWRSAIAAQRPVLVFVYSENGWMLRNVGGGPALNIVVAQKRVGGEWFNPVRIPPLAREAELALTWLGHVSSTGLGATYEDYESRPYTSTCGNDLTRSSSGAQFGGWRDDEIGRHWMTPPYSE